jgi:hypothetical protein
MTFFGLFIKLAEVASAPVEPRERMHRAFLNVGKLTCCRCLRPIQSNAVAITDGEGRRNYHAGCVPAAPDDYSGTGEVRDVRRLFRKPYYLRPELVLNSQFILFAPPCSIMPCGDYYIGLVAMGIKSYFYRYGDPARVLERMARLLAKTKR